MPRQPAAADSDPGDIVKIAIAAAMVAAALLVSLDVGSAQQASAVRFKATTGDELRTWDGYVRARERAGDLRIREAVRDPSFPARTIERLQQYSNGVSVWGAEVVRDVERGVPQSMFGELSADLDVDPQPGMGAEAAERLLLSRQPSGAALLKRAALTIVRLATGEHRLAYTAVVSADRRVFRVFVDASSGAELLQYSSIHTQAAVGTGRGTLGDLRKMSVLRQGGVYIADDQHRPPVLTTFDMRGNLTRAINVIDNGAPLFVSDIASDSDNAWTDMATIDAHASIGWTYDYYFKRHGRRGLDNQDRPIITTVNGVTQQAAVTLPIDIFFLYAANAFWCGECGPSGIGVMYFGNGIPPSFSLFGQTVTYLAASLDIVAHELSHGVIDSSSGLVYMNESGALNEAFSDIMGTSVEFFFQPVGNGLGQADYLSGEDSFRGVGGGLNGSRSMANPLAYDDPDHYSLRFIGTADDGGVHTNSSIVSHAFYLAIQGGTNVTSRLTVQGVGPANREQIEKAFYRAFVFMLPASATFATARSATIQAARDLYPSNAAVATAITQAWTAVGVD
jgi:thermolysin